MEVTEKNFCNEISVDLENEDRLFKKNQNLNKISDWNE